MGTRLQGIGAPPGALGPQRAASRAPHGSAKPRRCPRPGAQDHLTLGSYSGGAWKRRPGPVSRVSQESRVWPPGDGHFVSFPSPGVRSDPHSGLSGGWQEGRPRSATRSGAGVGWGPCFLQGQGAGKGVGGGCRCPRRAQWLLWEHHPCGPGPWVCGHKGGVCVTPQSHPAARLGISPNCHLAPFQASSLGRKHSSWVLQGPLTQPVLVGWPGALHQHPTSCLVLHPDTRGLCSPDPAPP